MDIHENEQPRYVMSVAADLLNIHPQTLRMYERKGLISPKRSGAQQRYYSLRDLDDVKEIRRLTREKGVNLAGVMIILELRRELEALKLRIDDIEHGR